MVEILKLRKVGRDVILFTDYVYYSEIVLHCASEGAAERIAVRLLLSFSDINSYLNGGTL